jgi:ankyrin repeat protein
VAVVVPNVVMSQSGIHAAAKAGQRKKIQRLHEQEGADVNETNWSGETPVFATAKAGHSACIRVLHALGTDVNKLGKHYDYGESPVSAAARGGHVDSIRVLHELGADVNKYNEDEYSSVLVAAINDQVECIRVLHALGGDINKCNNRGMLCCSS